MERSEGVALLVGSIVQHNLAELVSKCGGSVVDFGILPELDVVEDDGET